WTAPIAKAGFTTRPNGGNGATIPITANFAPGREISDQRRSFVRRVRRACSRAFARSARRSCSSAKISGASQISAPALVWECITQRRISMSFKGLLDSIIDGSLFQVPPPAPLGATGLGGNLTPPPALSGNAPIAGPNLLQRFGAASPSPDIGPPQAASPS